MSPAIRLYPDGTGGYANAAGHALRRETYVDAGENTHVGIWVLRDPQGGVLGYDRYRNDLQGRHRLEFHDADGPQRER